MTLAALNAAACLEHRVCAAKAAKAARPQHRTGAKPVALRALDRRSRHELRRVLAWCAKQSDWCASAAAVLHASIQGFAHAQEPRLFPQLAPGDALQLVREPDNPHDACAVRIDWRGHTLGYVPRSDNPDIALRLDAGEALVATISTVAQEATAWDAVEFEIATAPLE
ncbi:MAG: HIRAN domain-containing protein [Rhodanobacteraceae bacterium]